MKKANEQAFVYLLGCTDGARVRTYVGWTNNIAKRVGAHNKGKGARSTRGRNWLLLYVEFLNDRTEAMRREYFLKRDRKLRKRIAAGLSLVSPAS